MKLKLLLLLTALMLFTSLIYCQEKKDTIYFDEDWSICEQPVAEYYRVCTLNKDKIIYYKGDAEDYYIDGKPEMTGNYSDEGFKSGEFIFYNKNGVVIKKEIYKSDELFGNCFYYDTSGNLKAVFNCNSAVDFTPLEIINDNGDTLLKNGNGKFLLDVQKDMPKIFPLAENYVIEGEVIDSLKNGTFNYYISEKHDKAVFSEIYKNGKFIKAKSYGSTLNIPLKLLHLTEDNLGKADRFYHSNLLFELGKNGDQKVVSYLLNNEIPGIEASSQSFYDNDRIIFDVISKVLQHDLYNKSNTRVSYNFPSSNPADVYYSFKTSGNDSNSLRTIDGDIALTVDTNGYLINAAYNTTLTKTEINKINYYLSHVTGLMPHQNDNQKSIANINLKLNTVITPENGSLSAIYYVYNSDSTDQNSKSFLSGKTSIIFNTGVQVEAKFPGGQDAWRMYLERNLNNSVAAQHRAPNGTYTVTVSFLVDENGNISDVKADSDPGYGTAEEVIRVIKKGPKWIPAVKDGKNVMYRQKQNVTFQVSGY